LNDPRLQSVATHVCGKVWGRVVLLHLVAASTIDAACGPSHLSSVLWVTTKVSDITRPDPTAMSKKISRPCLRVTVVTTVTFDHAKSP